MLFHGNFLFAQQIALIESGSIEFEKTINMYAICKRSDMTEKSIEDYMKLHPQFLSLKSTLLFNNNKTLFVPGAMENPVAMLNSIIPFPYAIQRNSIYSDFLTGNLVNQKNMFEETVLIKDTIRKIRWKLTDEFREVAGYTCRRANGALFDSIYVVAFYTNEIHIPGGPESFAGLPGMILELALPHENVIWRAMKITKGGVLENTIYPPKKGTIINTNQLREKIKSSMNNFDFRLKDLLVKDLLI